MTNSAKSPVSEPHGAVSSGDARDSAPQGWLKVGVIAAASAALGGLAAAWFYRNALSRLREAEDEIPDSLQESIEDAAKEDF